MSVGRRFLAGGSGHSPEAVPCAHCRELNEPEDLDRMLWCEACRGRARARASMVGYVVGGVTAALLASWIWLYVRPSDLVLGGWIGTVLAALYLGWRIAREIAYGVIRARSRS